MILIEIYANERDKNIIKLGNDPKKPTLLMLSDADCPYCRMEVAHLNQSLEKNNCTTSL